MDEDTPIIVDMDIRTTPGCDRQFRETSNSGMLERVLNARRRVFDYHGLSVVETIVEVNRETMKLIWTRGPIDRTMIPDDKGVLRPTPCVHVDFAKDDQDGIYEEVVRRKVRNKFDRFYGLDGGEPEGRNFFYGGVAACE
jgi:hypothetical protein